MNEIRNELLTIMYIIKNVKESNDPRFKNNVDYLLDRFEHDIESKMKDAQYIINQCNENKEILDHVRKELELD